MKRSKRFWDPMDADGISRASIRGSSWCPLQPLGPCGIESMGHGMLHSQATLATTAVERPRRGRLRQSIDECSFCLLPWLLRMKHRPEPSLATLGPSTWERGHTMHVFARTVFLSRRNWDDEFGSLYSVHPFFVTGTDRRGLTDKSF